ncbi:hypothetical protein FDENT_2286 [Fusarium denticulatum]|uniref:Uncharacterized protein n=1 Tax=Fusarium denticulatum TaxID=48507 RepID=A0A8H5XG99_9HYPO|nr:hypothetical protein FDENT_2286 [Fusarium denticulatum]
MSNPPPSTTPAPGVFNPASISMEDSYDEKYLEPTRATLREIQDLIYKELEIMFFEDFAAQIRMYSQFKIGWRADHCMAVDNFDSQRIARYIFREWLRLHNGRPFFQRGGFLGKPLLLRDNGPQSLQEISTIHSGLSQYVSTDVEHLVEFERGKNWCSSYPGEHPPKDETPGDIRS